MPRSYPAEFRCKVPDLVEAGRPVAEIADQLGVAGQTIYNCYGPSGRTLAEIRVIHR